MRWMLNVFLFVCGPGKMWNAFKSGNLNPRVSCLVLFLLSSYLSAIFYYISFPYPRHRYHHNERFLPPVHDPGKWGSLRSFCFKVVAQKILGRLIWRFLFPVENILDGTSSTMSKLPGLTVLTTSGGLSHHEFCLPMYDKKGVEHLPRSRCV